MRTPALSLEDAAGRRLLTVTLTRVAVAAAVLVPAVVAIAVTWRLSVDLAWWPVPLLVVLLAVAAALPDSGIPAFFLAGLGAWWLAAVREPPVSATLAVAACLLGFHVAIAHAAAGPPGCEPSGAVVRSLLGRTAGVLVITAGLAVIALLVDDVSGAPPVLVAVTLVAVAALPWLVSTRR